MKSKMKIALVEDNRFHAILIERAVKERYPETQLTIYKTGQEFLARMKKKRFDMALIDYNLPDMNGLELLSLINSRELDIPVIIITGAGSEQTAVEAMKSGATDYVTKTGDFEQTIPRVIKQAYQKHRLIQKNRRLEKKARESEKLEMITIMASTLNHEINNPLMAIFGNLELLRESLPGSDNEIAVKLEMIEKSTQRIQEITQQMANLMTTSVHQTPVGPMLKLAGENAKRRKKPVLLAAAVNKTN